MSGDNQDVDWSRLSDDITPRRALIEIESELYKPKPDLDKCKAIILKVMPRDEKGA